MNAVFFYHRPRKCPPSENFHKTYGPRDRWDCHSQSPHQSQNPWWIFSKLAQIFASFWHSYSWAPFFIINSFFHSFIHSLIRSFFSFTHFFYVSFLWSLSFFPSYFYFIFLSEFIHASIFFIVLSQFVAFFCSPVFDALLYFLFCSLNASKKFSFVQKWRLWRLPLGGAERETRTRKT